MGRKHYSGSGLDVRFWNRVNKTGSCWLWTGTKHRQGYGFIYRNDESQLTHRWSWQLAHGPIPEGMMGLHKCDVPACVRRSHLFLGTQTDNMRDMVSKNRCSRLGAPKGEANATSKLTNQKVRKIRELYVPRAVSCTMLGKRFYISRATIHLVVQRKIWRHIA